MLLLMPFVDFARTSTVLEALMSEEDIFIIIPPPYSLNPA